MITPTSTVTAKGISSNTTADVQELALAPGSAVLPLDGGGRGAVRLASLVAMAATASGPTPRRRTRPVRTAERWRLHGWRAVRGRARPAPRTQGSGCDHSSGAACRLLSQTTSPAVRARPLLARQPRQPTQSQRKSSRGAPAQKRSTEECPCSHGQRVRYSQQSISPVNGTSKHLKADPS